MTALITPPKEAQRIAERALERQEDIPKSRRGGLTSKEASSQGITSGREQARRIATGKDVDPMQVHRFFSRFKSTWQRARDKDLKWEDSKILQAWDLWGGEPMRKHVNRIVSGDREKNPGGPSEAQLMRALRF